MKPVAIFRHAPTEGPGYFAIFLEQHGIPWQLIAVDAGEPVPSDSAAFSGLCFMGGPMSVNDPLPWIGPACALIRDATAKQIPVIGHCLGGQLMSQALGGHITRNIVKEIGWGTISAETGDLAQHWFGSRQHQLCTAFHWHGETFSIPPGATRIAGNAYCANQMFAVGAHLGMQCHVEMTPEMITAWCTQWEAEAASCAHMPSIQSPEAMQSEIAERLPMMRALADQLYGVWIGGLAR